MQAFDIPSLAVDVTLAVATGIAGLSLEDPTRDRAHPLHAFDRRSHGLRLRDTPSTSETAIALIGRPEFVCGRPASTKRADSAHTPMRERLALRAADRYGRAGRCDRRRGSLQTGERTDRGAIRDGRRSCGRGGATDQSRGEPWLGRRGLATSRQHRRSQTQDRSPGSRCCRTLTPCSRAYRAATGHPRWRGWLGRPRRSRNRGCCPVLIGQQPRCEPTR